VSDYDDIEDDLDLDLLDDDIEDGNDEADSLSWDTGWEVQQRVEQIRATYAAQARPLLALQKRNAGVRLPALAKLQADCEREVQSVVKSHQLAAAYERAARDQASGRAQMHAQERHQGQQNMAAFAADLGRGRYLSGPEPAGRTVHDTWIW
jgi:hypothetical protein